MMRLVDRAKRCLMRADRGTAVVELALVAPFMILLLVGAVETGRYCDFDLRVANAAKAGAQYGAQNVVRASDAADIAAAATSDAGLSGLTVTSSLVCTCADGSAATCQPTSCASSHIMEYVKVSVSGSMASLFNYPQIAPSISAASTVSMRIGE